MRRFLTLLLLPISVLAQEHIYHVDRSTTDEHYKMCLIGDSGTGLEGQYIVAQALEQEMCSEIRILGDVIYENGISDIDDPLLLTNFYTPYQNLFYAEGMFRLALGNHDYGKNPSAWIDVAAIDNTIFFPNLFYAEVYNDHTCVITLDTETIEKYYLYYDWAYYQSVWIQEILNEFQRYCEFSIVVGHRPYVSSGKHGDSEGVLRDFFETYIIGHVDLLASGHDHHLADEGTFLGTTQLISGAAAKLRKLKRTPHGGYGASVLGYSTVEFFKDTQGLTYAKYSFIEVDEQGNRYLGYENIIQGVGIR